MNYIIGDLAKLLNVSTNTIRRYEEMGYIKSIRDGEKGYRYYNEESVSQLMTIRLLRKYGFTHDELVEMKDCDVSMGIDMQEKKLNELDEKIAYLSSLRNRLNGNIKMMKRIDEFAKPGFIKDCQDFSYVLYQSGGRALKEKYRVKKVDEFLNKCPEVQGAIIIRKDNILRNDIKLDLGWLIKTAHLEKYSIEADQFVERYEKRRSLLSLAKISDNLDDLDSYESDKLQELFLSQPLKYIKENNLSICGDILCIIITKALEKGVNTTYYLVNMPIE